ncbi:hypothetical protein EV188_104260 [Actinomycetospora succinea]|uniref:Uncharacterized protein n=1 Tax=Actinomycetospora succinea TaxID=663603 RepID=A0A4R6VDP9_9PSEU|nr:hypothetical protein [Actinomycetospora succinea]TDQ58520.1 hypothetical protein EV188_104260 [Actinomycetospora succinea]
MSVPAGMAVHLYASDGRWIAWYRPGLPYLWSTRDRWIGWFPWSREPTPEPRDDVLDPSDAYLGTVVGDRLLARVVRLPRAFSARVPEPQRPVGPPDVDRAQAVAAPIGFVDVDAARLFSD